MLKNEFEVGGKICEQDFYTDAELKLAYSTTKRVLEYAVARRALFGAALISRLRTDLEAYEGFIEARKERKRR